MDLGVVIPLVAVLTAVALLVAMFIRERSRGRAAGASQDSLPLHVEEALDWRPVDPAEPDAGAALELWWELQPLLSIERVEDGQFAATRPVPGAVAEMVGRMLDNEAVRKVVTGQRFALVKLPSGFRTRDLVMTLDGRKVPVVRDAGGKFGRLGTVVGGAGVGGVAATAPAIVSAVAAGWAYQQLTAAVTASQDGTERIAQRLDDSDHGVLAAAQAQLAALSGPPASWSESDRDGLNHHRVALQGVYHTAKRRAERRLVQLEATGGIPKLDDGEIAEIQRDLVLRVDAELVAGQMELVQAMGQIETDPRTAMRKVAAVEQGLEQSLGELAARINDVVTRELPGRHRRSARRGARALQSNAASTVDELQRLLDGLSGKDGTELLIAERDGKLEIRTFEADTETTEAELT